MPTAAVKDVYHSIKAALDIFKSSAAATADVPSKQVLLQQAERVKADAAKSECRACMFACRVHMQPANPAAHPACQWPKYCRTHAYAYSA